MFDTRAQVKKMHKVRRDRQTKMSSDWLSSAATEQHKTRNTNSLSLNMLGIGSQKQARAMGQG